MYAQSVRTKRFATSAIAAEVGVEPELYSPTPRRVVDSRSTFKKRAWCANFVVGFVLLAYYCGTRNWFVRGIEKELLVLLSLLLAAVWSFSEAQRRRSRYFLQNGFAVRASVEEYKLSDTTIGAVEIRYYYCAMHGKQSTGYLTVPIEIANTLGGFAVGTTFTLLLHPTERYETLPYFQVEGAEIPGAAPARTTPP